MPKNVRDFGKLIVEIGFEKLPKVQKITQSGHTGRRVDIFQDIWTKELDNRDIDFKAFQNVQNVFAFLNDIFRTKTI